MYKVGNVVIIVLLSSEGLINFSKKFALSGFEPATATPYYFHPQALIQYVICPMESGGIEYVHGVIISRKWDAME